MSYTPVRVGQQTMAGSYPVVLASNQTSIPVTQSGSWTAQLSGSLPTGSNVIGGVTQSGNWDIRHITGTITLPTGAATEATLGAVESLLGGTLSVAGTLTANAGSGNFASNLAQYGGSSVGAANALHVQPGTSAVFPISDNGGSITIDGDVNASQSGAWTVQPGNTANTTPWLFSLNAGGVTASILDLTNSNPLTAAIVDASGNQITSFGGGTQYAEGAEASPATGTLAMWKDQYDVIHAVGETAPLPVDIVSGSITIGAVTIDNGAGAAAVNIQDGGNSITVDGSITANQGGSWDINDITGTITLPTGAATEAKQPALGTAGSASADVITIQGVASMTPVQVSDGGGSLTVDGTVAATQSGSWTVNIQDGGNSITVDNGGTFAVQAAQSGTWTLGANSGVDIGDVTINNGSGANAVNIQDGGNTITVDGTVSITANSSVNLSQVAGNTTATGNGTASTGCQRVTIASDNTAFTVNSTATGAAATDAAVSGNPVYIAGRANLNEPTAVSADGDVVPPWLDRHGRLVTLAGHSNPEAPVSVNVTSSGNNTVISAPGASVSLYIQKVSVHNRDSSNVLVALQDGAGGTTRWRAELAAEGGGSLIDFGSRGWKLTANTLLNVNLGGASSVDVNVTEYYIAP